MAEIVSKPEFSSPPNPDEPEMEEDADVIMNIDPTATEKPAADIEMEEEPIPEPREPTKKDISLRDFLAKMDDYAPIVGPLKVLRPLCSLCCDYPRATRDTALTIWPDT